MFCFALISIFCKDINSLALTDHASHWFMTDRGHTEYIFHFFAQSIEYKSGGLWNFFIKVYLKKQIFV